MCESQLIIDETADRTEKNVYVRIDSKTADRKFEALLEKKNIIQDFLNFVITGDSVPSKSIYGVTEGSDGEKPIEIRYKSFSTESLTKCKVISPVLFHSIQYGDERLEQIIKYWFDFRKSHSTIYGYYVNSLYKGGEAIELSYFKLATFLEGYHRELLEKKGKSQMRKVKDSNFESIERMLEESEVDEGDTKIIKFIIAKNKDLTLAQRLKEILESYRDIVSICGPVLSFFDNNKLHKWIRETCTNESAKNKLTKVIDLKIEADYERIKEKRIEKYNMIADFLKGDPTVLSEMLSLVEVVVMSKFLAEFAKYRNIIGHLLDRDYQKVDTNKWFYAFKTLQLTGQICVLEMLGFSYQEICNIFFMDRMDERTKLSIMIETNIGF